MRHVVIGGAELSGSSVGTGPPVTTDLGAVGVVIDLTQSPSIRDTPVPVFFEISTAYLGDVEHSFRLIASPTFD